MRELGGLVNSLTKPLLTAVLISFGYGEAANAEKLCLKVSVANGSGKVTTQKKIVDNCPAGFTELLDLAAIKSSPAKLASGKTVRGVISGSGPSNTLSYFTQSLPAASSAPIKTSDMIIAHTPRLLAYCSDTYGANGIATCLSSTELAKNEALCTGTFDNPTAPAGKVCIYIDSLFGSYGLEGQLTASPFNGEMGSPYGFSIQWYTENGYTSKVKASWAYKAP